MTGEQAHHNLPIDRQSVPELGAHDIDPECPRDGDPRDRWLRENVPPHHR
jgi:hypothetical protein